MTACSATLGGKPWFASVQHLEQPLMQAKMAAFKLLLTTNIFQVFFSLQCDTFVTATNWNNIFGWTLLIVTEYAKPAPWPNVAPTRLRNLPATKNCYLLQTMGSVSSSYRTWASEEGKQVSTDWKEDQHAVEIEASCRCPGQCETRLKYKATRL